MFNKNVQYINLIKSQQNMKIDYQILKDNDIIKKEQSVFLLEDNALSLDTNFKILALEKNTNNSIITSICEDSKQRIINIDEDTNFDCKEIYFDSKRKIILEQQNINESKKFYNDGLLDYLLSPFTILHHILNDKLDANSLNIFILNNTIYSLILDQEKRIVSSCVKLLTSFEDIKKSNFYNDEIVEQKLYDEVYMLELNEAISSISKAYYEENKNATFIEICNIFYNIKQLTDSQLDSLKDILMIDINYQSVPLNDIMHELVKKQSINKSNYINVREKKKSLSFGSLSVIFILLTLIIAAIIYLMQMDSLSTAEKKKAPIEKKILQIEEIFLPNHRVINNQILNLLRSLFHSIPNNAVLKELQLQKNESTFIYNYKENEKADDKELKSNLEEIYEKSENILTSQNKEIFTAIISNTTLKEKLKEKVKVNYIQNMKYQYLEDKELKKYLFTFFNNETKIKQISSSKSKHTTKKFFINTIIEGTEDLIRIINKLSKNYYSITISYPIELIKTKEGIETSFYLKINQKTIAEDKNTK